MDLTNISVGVALAYSVLGFAVVFLGLICFTAALAPISTLPAQFWPHQSCCPH